ncbi:MAG: hypothetical protein KZQ58_12925 [gamma proteobacterium symbiont of Bathyaustriella thionipta]|nr:hypothetical protein [gamma proteobacterium symbiont of Bathyaustriella thionipta]
MTNLPERQQQIIMVHAAFIRQIVESSLITERQHEATELLRTAEQQGWKQLVSRIRRIIKGDRSDAVLNGLDEEDRIIAEAILRGLQDPATLPDVNQKPEPSMAGPGLASMIEAAGSGNVEALQIIAGMAEQMSKAGGQMARLAAVIRPMIDGERDANKLTEGMNADNEKLVLDILSHLSQHSLH